MTYLLEHFPYATHALAAIGGLRVIFKPITFGVRVFLVVDDSPKERAWLARLKQKTYYKVAIWFVDLVMSVKLPGQP